MDDVEPGQVEQKQKRLISPIIILVLAIIFIIWVMALFMNKDLYDEFGMDISKEWWVYIASMIMIIFIVFLLVRGFPARAPAAEPTFTPAQMATLPQVAGAGPAAVAAGVMITEVKPVQLAGEMAMVEAEPVVVEAEVVEVEPIEEEEVEAPSALKTKKPRLLEYPKKVPGGVYGDTIIRVDPRTKLNLRTLLVRSCLICDRQGKCWEEIMDTIPRDQFLENIDCKKGLRKLKGHGAEGESPKLKKKLVKRVRTVDES